ncbi:glutamate carboxypeptidase 2-like [Mizuhopecten yessoensis]|uniref:glutamate carboxypeptidase 2-like n=1 Tax=Mizuhopecten yessoensis TaxID=6573 RepID=UPI000B458C53|nr:glutamate carboxypeptidase 2-like [Mizuhopecten yessoensis]
MSFRNHKGIGVAALVAVLLFVLGILIGFFSTTTYGPDSGSCPGAGLQQLTREADPGTTDTLLTFIDAQHMAKVYRELTSKPRLAGTDSQRESADYVHNLFQEYGLTSQIDTYDVFLSYPIKGHNNFAAVISESGTIEYRTLSLEELTRDDTRHPDEIQAFNAFSPSGDITAELVYANYGRAEDFDKLWELGVNCSGKIVIVREMEAEEVLPEWRGNLNITYRVGPTLRNNRKIRLVVENENRTVPIHNVIGKITGAIEPDRYVIFGNHRDAWVYGGTDPASGGTVLMEIARIFGKLLETGWRPRRTILFCSWDAEEYGLVGSYEWVEENLKWLTSNAVAYLNIDSAVSGNKSLLLQTVPLLQQVFFDATKQVPDPHVSGQSAYDVWRGQLDKPRTERVGSGSDHTPFVANAGVPSFYATFASADDWNSSITPLYHTRYETTNTLLTIDPGYKISGAMAGILAETGRRLTDSLVLPLGVRDYAEDLRASVDSLNFSVSGIVEEKYIKGVLKGTEALFEAVDKFEKEKENLDLQNPLAIRNLNDKMMALEGAFLDVNGIPYRQHYKHLLHTPSATNHYGGQGFPGAEDLLFRWKHNSTRSAVRELEGHLSVIAHALFSAAKVLVC